METTNAVRALAALAQETRLSIFRLLVEAGPTGLAAGEIAAGVGVSPTNLSFHLKELAASESGSVEVPGFLYVIMPINLG